MDTFLIDELANTIQSFTGSAFVAMVTIAFLFIIGDWIVASKGRRTKRS